MSNTCRIKLIIAKTLNIKPEKIKTSSNLCDDLLVDSVDHVELIMKIEREFNINLSNERFDKNTTVKDLIRIVEEGGHEL